jgi:hypothetical protein
MREVMRLAFVELGYSGKFYRSESPEASSSVHFWEEARWLLTEGRLRDPDNAVSRLEQLVRDNEVIVHRVEAVWGLHPDRPLSLAAEPRLMLLPLENLRSSSARDALLGTAHSGPAPTKQPRPRAVIVHELVQKPVYFPAGERTASFAWEDRNLLSDLALVLVLLNDSPVVSVAAWNQTALDVPVFGTNVGWGWSFSDERVSVEIPPESYDEELASHMVSAFLELSSLDKRRMTIALRRLNHAWLRQRRSDTALELGIALEALLTEGR